MFIDRVTTSIRRAPLYSIFAVLEPQGIIAAQEKSLLIHATLLMLVVVVPVFVLTAAIAWWYRAGNAKATYRPNWEHNVFEESVWWGVPAIIIALLAVMTWTSSHELDPFKPIQSDVKPLVIQVVALNWKWLFIYPEQHIATLNTIEIPDQTPIRFEITADAPMNSFWIPQLGGQIYAMPGMVSQLNLMADGEGDYRGVSANFSGTGFSGMHFDVKSRSQNEFDQWVSGVQASTDALDPNRYRALREPSSDEPPSYFSSVDSSLYTSIVESFMRPHHDTGMSMSQQE